LSQNEPVELLLTVPFSPDLIDRIRNISPRLQITEMAVRRVEEIPAEFWARTEILYTDTVLPEITSVPRLRWIQLHFAGVDYALESPVMQSPEIKATTLSGVAVPQMAEYILMMLLALGHRIPDLMVAREKADWPKDRWERFTPRELRGSTVGIVGYGSIGREVARLLQVFGVTVLATKRDVMHPEDTGYSISGLGDPQGDFFHRLYPVEALGSMLKESDFVVVTLPLTSKTRGLINADMLRNMKAGSFLVDVGRGGIIEPAALITALQERWIGGAALDVFSEEPLPSNSPFWRLPNTIVTPHVAGISSNYKARAIDLFTANLERYLNGEKLFNLFNPEKMY